MRLSRILVVVAALLVLVAAGLAVGYHRLTRSGLPQREGTAVLTGLEAPVSIRFDRWGVPHVEAESPADAAAALGWLHANDRMTQLELGRRAASGRLSELVGEVALDLDREALTLRLREAAESLWQAAGPESRDLLEAYADGVNAWLRSRGVDLPPGLRLLAVEPEPWTPVDSLCFALLMARDLAYWQDRPEEDRFGWLAAFGAERTRELVGADVHGTMLPPAIEEEAAAAALGLSTPPESGESGTAADDASPGSNNWALGASRVRDGSSAVANDPHLGLGLPAVWYQALLRSPGYEVSGMTLPGLPGVVVGRGAEVSWVVTNTMLDDHDLFFERLDASGERVQRGEGWEPIRRDVVSIAVDGGDPVELERFQTDLGPLLPPDEERGLPWRSLAWTAYEPADPLAAFVALARSGSAAEAVEAIASYAAPAQNLVVADRAGGLAYTVLGRLPERRTGDGRLPSPGWDPSTVTRVGRPGTA